MGYFITICKLLLFFISNLGLWEYFRRKSGMNIYFLPAFTICFQITVLFCAGILNCLEAAALFLYGVGLFLAVYYLFTDFKNVICVYWNGGYLFLVLSFAMLLIVCRGRIFIEYDNFSHWALVVKSMLLTDRYPSFQDTMIIFQEYPLGSASYIYYFAKMLSNSEAIQMVAQGFMMLSFILPVFKCVKRNVLIAVVYILVFVNFMFCYNVLIRDLLVDTLLPLQGMATLFFIYSECLKLDNEKTGGHISLYAIPFLCTVVQIKNSGIYFVVLACILFGISMSRGRTDSKKDKAAVRQKVLTMVAPFVSLYLWHAHCNYVFSSSSVTKHAMTLQNYQSVFSQKTGNDISAILSNVLKFSISGQVLYNLILFIVITGVVAFFLGTHMRKKYLWLVLVCALIYISYMMGTAAMYLFSMGGVEAEKLMSIERYRGTIFIAIYYLFLLFSLEIISSIENIKKNWICLVGIYGALLIAWTGGRSFPIIYADETREMLEQVIEDNGVPTEASYLICTSPERDGGYLWYMCRYVLWSDHVLCMNITEKSQLDENAENCEYILVLDEGNTSIQEWVRQNYPEQEGRTVIDQK